MAADRNNDNRYSVFDDNEDDLAIQWSEKTQTYTGGIKPGMGVQRRYTGSSFIDLESGERMDEVIAMKGRSRLKNVTWFLHDPLERWKRGLHPLSGRRGAEFTRIGYYR